MAKLKMQNAVGKDNEWTPMTFHRVHPDLVGERKWWATVSNGIYELGADKPFRTPGRPRTLERVDKNLGMQIADAIDTFGRTLWEPKGYGTFELAALSEFDRDELDRLFVLVGAVMANENGGRLVGDRYEKHINDWSFGPAQFLTSTALAIAKKHGLDAPPPQSMKQDSSKLNGLAWKRYLENPRIASDLAVCLLCDLSERFDLRGDPVLIYASYNAGSPRPTKTRTPWGLVAYDKDGLGPAPGALDHFVRWYGDACRVLGQGPGGRG